MLNLNPSNTAQAIEDNTYWLRTHGLPLHTAKVFALWYADFMAANPEPEPEVIEPTFLIVKPHQEDAAREIIAASATSKGKK